MIVAVDAGIPGFGDFINAIILLAVISIGLSGVYGGSRTLTALAEQGYAPKIFGYIDRAGRPLVSTLMIIAFGPLAYVSLASSGEIVFSWLLALSGLAALFTWGSICLSHIRFRHAWKYHGHTLDELPFRAPFGVWGSWVGLIIIVLVLIAQVSTDHSENSFTLSLTQGLQFYTAVEPLDAYTFFNSYLALFVVMLFYAIGYAWKRQGWLKLSEIDVDSGRRELDYEAFEKLKAKRQNWPAWRRFLDYIF